MSGKNCKVVPVFGQAEVLFQNEKYFDAIILECEGGSVAMIHQNGNCINLHINSIDLFIKSLRSVAAKCKSTADSK